MINLQLLLARMREVLLSLLQLKLMLILLLMLMYLYVRYHTGKWLRVMEKCWSLTIPKVE